MINTDSQGSYENMQKKRMIGHELERFPLPFCKGSSDWLSAVIAMRASVFID